MSRPDYVLSGGDLEEAQLVETLVWEQTPLLRSIAHRRLKEIIDNMQEAPHEHISIPG